MYQRVMTKIDLITANSLAKGKRELCRFNKNDVDRT